MDKIVEVLIEKETITGDEFRTMLSKFTKMPEASEPMDQIAGVSQI